MTCLICKQGTTEPGETTVTLEAKNATIVFKGVPAQICSVCGEVYVDRDISKQLLREASEAASSGVQVEVRTFAA